MAGVVIPGSRSLESRLEESYYEPFRQRLTVAVAVVGLGVLAEDPATPRHAARVEVARIWLTDPETQAGRLVWLVLADGVTTVDAGDQALCDRLAAVLSALAGA
jgi:hypothetical protein